MTDFIDAQKWMDEHPYNQQETKSDNRMNENSTIKDKSPVDKIKRNLKDILSMIFLYALMILIGLCLGLFIMGFK